MRPWLLVSLAGCDLVLGLRRRPDADIDDGVDAPDGLADRDHDGIADDADNCPDDANPAQHDEDGDRLGDVCDTCPHAVTGSNLDEDGDGIGDDCDPRSDVVDLFVFDGFNEAMLDPRWTVTGPWSTDAGNLVVTATGAARIALSSPSIGAITVIASLEVNGPMAGGTGGLLFDYTDLGHLCGLQLPSTRGMFRFTTPSDLVEVSTVAGGMGGVSATYTVSSLAATRTCTTASVSTVQVGFSSPHVDRVGIAALNATVKVGWVVVIVSPP